MRYLRYFLTIVLIIVAVFVIYPKFKNVYRDVPALLNEANKSLLFFLVIFQVINYLGDAWLAQTLLTIANFRVGFKNTLKVAILGVIGNHVAPFVGGTVVTYYFYKKLNVPAAIISFLVFAWTLFIWLISFFLFLVSLMFLPNLFFSLISLRNLFIIFIIIVTTSLLCYALFRKKSKHLISLFNIFSKLVNQIGLFFNKRNIFKPKFFEKFIFDFHQCLDLLLKNEREIPKLIISSLMFYLGDIATLYFSFLVFGYHANIALLVFGYTISIVLTVFTLMPGAPGVMEASLMMVFIKLGFPIHVVLFASILFRLFSYWLPLPIGLFPYLRLKKENKTS
jgi:glycosyltransferase 2 family protein